MPFCTQCGQTVLSEARYCASCGSPQPLNAARAGQAESLLNRLSPRTAALLCYVPFLGWIACIVVLAAQRFRQHHDVRFHAFQGLYLYVAWLVLDWGVTPMLDMLPEPFLRLDQLLKAALVVAWIFMLVKTSQNQVFHLPFFGELAERSVAEQQ